MFIGKWNKSVFLTYVGLIASVVGMSISYSMKIGIKYAFICFMIAGICDLFDGYVARKCKRTEEEKAFGIQLDSLVDVVSFVVFPIVLMMHMGLNHWYNIAMYCIYGICGVARLAYFNITAETTEGPVKYYAGLPVTFSTFILTVCYIFKLWLSENVFEIFYSILPLIIAILFISNIKIKKSTKVAYIFFPIIAFVVTFIYLFYI